MTHKATCQTCKQFSTFSSRRSIPSADLPPILAVNASVYNDDNLKYWMDTRTGRFLSPTVEVRGEIEGIDDAESVTYELRVCVYAAMRALNLYDRSHFQAIVCQIMTKAKHSHLVAIVKGKSRWLFSSSVLNFVLVPDAENQPHLKGPWFLFNDFVVRNISEDEALSFPSAWKVCAHFTCSHSVHIENQVPAVLYLEREDLRSRLDLSGLPDELDPSILSRDTSISV